MQTTLERYVEIYRQHNIYQDIDTKEYCTLMDDIGRVVASNLFLMHEAIDENMDRINHL